MTYSKNTNDYPEASDYLHVLCSLLRNPVKASADPHNILLLQQIPQPIVKPCSRSQRVAGSQNLLLQHCPPHITPLEGSEDNLVHHVLFLPAATHDSFTSTGFWRWVFPHREQIPSTHPIIVVNVKFPPTCKVSKCSEPVSRFRQATVLEASPYTRIWHLRQSLSCMFQPQLVQNRRLVQRFPRCRVS